MSSAPARKVVLVLEDGSDPAGTVPQLEPYEQAVAFARYGDAEVLVDFYKQDRTDAPIEVGSALLLVVRRNYFDDSDPPIAVQADVADAGGGALCASFSIPESLMSALEVADYVFDVYYQQASGVRWQVLPASPFVVLRSPGVPGAPLTPGGSSTPLGLSTVCFRRTIVQPDDDDDFIVDIPEAVRFPSSSYGVSVQLASDVTLTSFAAPIADRAIDSLRIITGSVLPNGAVLEITLAALGS